MTQGLTYLDHNATTPLKPGAKAAMANALDLVGNASSVHRHGRLVRRMIETARERVAALVSASPAHIIFTSGGTEANNLAMSGFVKAAGVRHVIVSAIEHDSVLEAANASGATVHVTPVNTAGVVELGALGCLLAKLTPDGLCLVCVMLANNETGVVQPVSEIAALAKTHSARLHCDAVQAAGKMPIDFTTLNVDMLSLSAHKLGGPAGVGALVVKEGIVLTPLIAGGGQERRRRSGTENITGIAGFGEAARLALRDMPVMQSVGKLRDDLEKEIVCIAPGAEIFGRQSPRVPNTICFGVDGLSAETQVMALDLAGVSVSSGAACSSGKVARSHVLQAMEIAPSLADSTLRISLGWNTTDKDTKKFIAAWQVFYQKHVSQAAVSMQA